VTVHCVGLQQPGSVVARLAALLAPGELERAARMGSETLRRRFLVAHGALRVLVAGHAGLDPVALRFDTSGEAGGKPRLVGPPPARATDFNLSHSGELALVAIASGVEVGVDVEELRPLDDLGPLARRVLAPAEAEALRLQPAGRRLEEWYRAWVRKEAVLKASGRGLEVDPRQVQLLPPDFTPVSSSPGFARATRGAGWSVALLQPAPGHVAAVAALRAGLDVRTARWPG
jgi:4'-phosphopantetheinyl transferase